MVMGLGAKADEFEYACGKISPTKKQPWPVGKYQSELTSSRAGELIHRIIHLP